MPDEKKFTFKAGQFIMLSLPLSSKTITRSYSIASPPSDDNIFELVISRNPVGKGTTYIWENFREGFTISVSKVLGKFILPEEINTDLCFVCTGTGIAPFRSQLFDMVNKKIQHKNIYLVFGNRYERDILYRKELEDLQQNMSNFYFIPVLSRDTQWSGRNGYVHEVYEEFFADRRPALFMLCGWRDMLKEARERIAAMGYDKKAIRFETYD